MAKVKVGDRVRLTGKFLRNTGQMVGSEGQKEWTILACDCGLCERGDFVAVDEIGSFGNGQRHINAGNLYKRGTLHHDNAL